MHLLLRIGNLTPTEIAHQFGAMGKGLPGPEPNHAGQGTWVKPRPIDGTWLLFHDPQMASANAAIQIMKESGNIWVTYSVIPNFIRHIVMPIF